MADGPGSNRIARLVLKSIRKLIGLGHSVSGAGRMPVRRSLGIMTTCVLAQIPLHRVSTAPFEQAEASNSCRSEKVEEWRSGGLQAVFWCGLSSTPAPERSKVHLPHAGAREQGRQKKCKIISPGLDSRHLYRHSAWWTWEE